MTASRAARQQRSGRCLADDQAGLGKRGRHPKGLAVPIDVPYSARMRQTWRVSSAIKVFGVLTIALGALVLSVNVLSPIPVEFKIVYAVPQVAFLVVAYVVVFRPSITMTDSELIIRNVFRTHRIAVRDIERVDAGYAGIAVQTKDGRVVKCWAAQKPNLYRWMGWRSRADNVADEIRKHMKGESI